MNGIEHHILGDDYFYARNGKPKDDKLAFEHWKKGAELNSKQCMENIAWAYRDGIGVEPNKKKAEFWRNRYWQHTTYYSDPKIRQDKWVESVFGGRHSGYFVEVGASDGIGASNCYFLEHTLEWDGICIEPNPTFFNALQQNRRSPCVQCPVAPEESEVNFRLAGYFSGIESNLKGWHKEEWENGEVVWMKTRRLEDILDEHNAPDVIDYLSLDIEGGESAIIDSFPFERYRVLTMTVEQSDPSIIESIERAGFRIVDNPFAEESVSWEHHCIHVSFQ